MCIYFLYNHGGKVLYLAGILLSQPVRQLIKNKYKKMAQRQADGFARAIFNLERVYMRVHQNNKASTQDSLKATRQFLLVHLYSADFYFLLFGLTLLAFTTRAFAEPGIDYGAWRPVVIGLAGLLAGVIPLMITMVLFPLHLIYRASIWNLTALNIVTSAIIFSLVEPVIPHYFYREGILHFGDLIGGMLVFYALAISYLQLRIHRKVCFRIYRQRHKKTAIEDIVPADKRGPLIALSAQDHYVEIVTENGRHLNRISMTDALKMVSADMGMQVHRSHWVAYNSMLSLEKSAGRHYLVLRNGAHIPVAKSKMGDVQKYLETH